TNGVSNVLAVGISNEVPSARYLYLLIANGNQTNLNRIDITTNAVSLQSLAAINTGIFQFAAVPPQTGATSFLQFNKPQTSTATSPAAPLIALVLASNGQPVFSLPVSFTAGNGFLDNPNALTDTNGLASTFFSAGTPAAGAVFEPVTVNASTAVGSVNFTETSYHVNFDGSGRPGIYLLAPGITSNNTI